LVAGNLLLPISKDEYDLWDECGSSRIACNQATDYGILSLVRHFTVFFCAICIASAVYGQAVFTADYYLVNPDAYLGKEVTLSVSSLNPRNEQPPDDGLRQLDAQTANQHKNGVTLMLAPPAIAASLIQLCGTQRSGKVGAKVTMFHGVFSQEKTGLRRYYLHVAH
jgi:hypothetical protein